MKFSFSVLILKLDLEKLNEYYDTCIDRALTKLEDLVLEKNVISVSLKWLIRAVWKSKVKKKFEKVFHIIVLKFTLNFVQSVLYHE